MPTLIDISGKVNQDLVNERKKCTFNVEEMAKWWCGGEEKLQDKRKMEKFFFDDLSLRDPIPTGYLSHKELFTESARKHEIVTRKVHQFIAENGGAKKDIVDKLKEQISISSFLTGSEVFRDGHPFNVHYGMFQIGLMNFATKEQFAKWAELVFQFKIIGTYAQTELGHGTNVRAIGTTATYDSKTEEFVMNTPTLEAYKWWPGGLGHNCSHAIVVAQLYTNGKCHGIHQFLVPIRNPETWNPMPGVEVGECGPKLGTRNYNNGFLRLNNVRIPRTHMLMKFSQVLKDGTHVQSPSDFLGYTTMMYIRAAILQDACRQLSKAVTIATRYSAVRHQSPIEPNAPEPQIIEHITQQYKLLPQIATCFAFKMLSTYMQNMFIDIMDEVENRGEFSKLPEIHALLSCFKPMTSAAAANGCEQLRLACGGHGYMDSANFTKIYSFATAACTYEGENTVLWLQAARYLIKTWRNMVNGGPLAMSVAYFKDTNLKNIKWELALENIIKAFQAVSVGKTKIAYENIQKRIKDGHSQEQATNMTGILLVQAAEAHAVAALVEIIYKMTWKIKNQVSNQLRTVIEHLIELYVLDMCTKKLNDLLRFTNITEKNIAELQSRIEQLLELLRPNAVGLVDGFDIHDVALCSTLGSYDGNVYERLYNDAKKSPLNNGGYKEAIELHLKPLMKAHL